MCWEFVVVDGVYVVVEYGVNEFVVFVEELSFLREFVCFVEYELYVFLDDWCVFVWDVDYCLCFVVVVESVVEVF